MYKLSFWRLFISFLVFRLYFQSRAKLFRPCSQHEHHENIDKACFNVSSLCFNKTRNILLLNQKFFCFDEVMQQRHFILKRAYHY